MTCRCDRCADGAAERVSPARYVAERALAAVFAIIIVRCALVALAPTIEQLRGAIS